MLKSLGINSIHAAGGGPTGGKDPTYHGGPLLTSVRVQCVYWGASWNSQATLISQLQAYFKFVLTSSLMDLLAEYNVEQQEIGHGSVLNDVLYTSSEPGGAAKTISDGQIQTQVDTWVKNGTLAGGANTLYFVFLPPGVASTYAGGAFCSKYCAYHNSSPGGNVYAVMPYFVGQCAGCGFATTLSTYTILASHELCEAITNPFGSGWWDSNVSGNEIGDFCNRIPANLGSYQVQRIWSNEQGKCAIGPPIAAVAGSPLVSFAINGDSTRLYFFDSSHIIHELAWANNGWQITTVNPAGTVPAAPDSALTGFALNGDSSRLYYLDTRGYVHELAWANNGWQHQTLSPPGFVPAAAGSALTSFALNGDSTRLYYLDASRHFNELAWANNGWQHQTLNPPGYVLAAPYSALTSFALNGDSTRLYYLDETQYVNELAWANNGWQAQTLKPGGYVTAVPTSALTSFALNGDSTRLYYLDVLGYVHELAWANNGWQHSTLNPPFNTPASPLSALTSFALNGDSTRLYYLDSAENVHELAWANNGWQSKLVNPKGAVPAARGSALTSFAYNGDATRLYYLGASGRAHEFAYANGGWLHKDIG